MKLLIVDDDARIRKIIAAMVSDISDDIAECSNGKEACDTYETFLPDWVTMDLRMPGVDGITATRMIRTDFPEAKIIILTTYESDMLRESATAAGACAYVLKEDLTQIRSILQGNSVPA